MDANIFVPGKDGFHAMMAAYRREAEESVKRVAGRLSAQDRERQNHIASETTIGAMKCDGGGSVLMFSDGMVTNGWRETYRTDMVKIRPLDPVSAIAICGMASSGIHVVNWLRMVFELYRFNGEKRLSVEGKLEQVDYISMLWCAYGLTFYPIFAAYDEQRGTGRLFDIWGDGGGRDEKEFYYANGSGGERATSILDASGWRGQGDAQAALLLAAKAAHHATDKAQTVNDLHHAFVIGPVQDGNWSGITWMSRERIAAANAEVHRLCNHPQCNANKGGA